MMPNMATTLHGFEESMQFQIVVKTVDDHDVIETSKVKPPLYFQGVLQPLHPRELLVKPEGERDWKWWTLFADITLNIDWVVKDPSGKLYRVMNDSTWNPAGFAAYQLVEGPGVDQ